MRNPTNHSFFIINRWGDKVFEAAPYQNDWEGIRTIGFAFGGELLPEGTYFYILNLGEGGNRKEIKGYIYLSR